MAEAQARRVEKPMPLLASVISIIRRGMLLPCKLAMLSLVGIKCLEDEFRVHHG